MADITMEELEKELYAMWSSLNEKNADEYEKRMNDLCFPLLDKGVRLSPEANGYATGITHLVDGIRFLKQKRDEDARKPTAPKKLRAFARQR